MRKFKGFDKNFSLEGKSAVITGGASGIGYAVARMFHEKGAKVAIFDISQNVTGAAREISEVCLGLKTDITDIDSIHASLKTVKENFGRIDVLCNIAGLGHSADAADVKKEDWESVTAVNMTGLFFMCQQVGRIMIEQGNGGKIINMSSQAGVVGLAQHACYGATKAAVINITKTLANEWGKHRINVNAVSPTVILTPMCEDYWTGERAEKLLDKIPIGRFGFPDEAAACFVFLASDASDMITGTNLVIDGGFTIC